MHIADLGSDSYTGYLQQTVTEENQEDYVLLNLILLLVISAQKYFLSVFFPKKLRLNVLSILTYFRRTHKCPHRNQPKLI